MVGKQIDLVMDNIIFSLQKVGGGSEYWGKLVKQFDSDLEINLEMIERADALENYTRRKIEPLSSPIHKSGIRNLRLDELRRIDTKIKTPTIFHSSYFRTSRNDACLNVTTIHDFISAKYYKGLLRAFSLWQMRRAVKHSDAIICITESTKKDLLSFIPEAASLPIRIINQGFNSDDYDFDPAKDIKPIKDQVVFIGRRSESYKNFNLTVEAVAENGRVRLVIIGAPLSPREKKHLSETIPGKYESIVYPEAKEVAEIMKESLCLLYPSEYEGFGLPVLEGMACGTPVIAMDKSSIPEVAGDASLLLQESSVDRISRCINNLLDNESMFEEYRARGLERVKLFSWEKTAQKTKEYYIDILNQSI